MIILLLLQTLNSSPSHRIWCKQPSKVLELMLILVTIVVIFINVILVIVMIVVMIIVFVINIFLVIIVILLAPWAGGPSAGGRSPGRWDGWTKEVVWVCGLRAARCDG